MHSASQWMLAITVGVTQKKQGIPINMEARRALHQERIGRPWSNLLHEIMR